MSRKQAREKAFQCLFGQNFNSQKDDLWSLTLKSSDEPLSQEDGEFVNELCFGVMNNLEEIKKTLEKALKGYDFNELYQVDKTILMIAIFELQHTDTNKKIVINEAVELSKKYGIEKSPKFVNGVLAGVLKLDE